MMISHNKVGQSVSHEVKITFSDLIKLMQGGRIARSVFSIKTEDNKWRNSLGSPTSKEIRMAVDAVPHKNIDVDGDDTLTIRWVDDK